MRATFFLSAREVYVSVAEWFYDLHSCLSRRALYRKSEYP